MEEKKKKIYKYSFYYDVVIFFILLIVFVFFGYLLENILLSALIFSFLYIIYFFYQQYFFENWIFNFQSNKSLKSHRKYQYLTKKIENIYNNFSQLKDEFNLLERRSIELSKSLPDAVIIIDKYFQVEWFNEAAQKMLSLKEMDTGTPITYLIRNPEFLKFVKKLENYSFTSFVSPENDNFFLKSMIVPYDIDKYLLIFSDITGSNRIEKMKTDFIANVSHELKSPLTVILGYLEIFSYSENKNIDNKIFESMLIQAQKMNLLINNLLNLAKLESAPTSWGSYFEFNLKDIISEVVQACLNQAKKNKNKIKVLSSLDLYINCCYDEIYSAFLNLLNNAITYAGKFVDIEINYFINEIGETFVSFKDFGIGVPEDVIDRLTERFYRFENSQSRNNSGTGLGLSIVKHVMQKHGGQLKVHGIYGKEITFVCIFPKSLYIKNLSNPAGNV